MTTTEPTPTPNAAPGRNRRGIATLFPLAVGVAAGLLIGALVIPDGVTETGRVTTGRGGEFTSDTGDPFGEATDGTLAGDPQAGGGTAVDGGGGGRPGSQSTGGGGGGGALGGSAAEPAGEAQGVVGDRIKIGVAIPDIGPFAVVDEFNLGDMRGHMESIIDRWKREGRIPVHGRQVEFVYRVFSIIGDEDVASCNGFVKDDKVFMVIGMRSYEGGSECLADRFDTPVISLEHVGEEGEAAYQRLHPFLFTLRSTPERVGRNFVHWAHANGHLRGKTIGIYSEDPDGKATDKEITQELNALGYQVAARASTTSKRGGPDDQVAVQRFQARQVDLALLLVAALPATSFMEQANAQGYRPTYLEMDYGDHTSDAASSTFPDGHFNGTVGVSMTRVGDVGAGRGLAAVGEQCVANYERYSGRRLSRQPPESAEMVMLMQACDEAEVVITALERAGRNLSRASFIAGAESISEMPGASHGTLSFSPTKHHGGNSQRTVQWQRSCTCWIARDEFGPLPRP